MNAVTTALSLVSVLLAEPTQTPFQREGIYDRPYITRMGGTTAVGGYAEVNTNALREDGTAEGFGFEMRRFNLFVFSRIGDRLRLTAELEFEHGAEEIKIETSIVDVMLHTAFNLRAGVLLTPVGRFNIAHDSPRYNVVDRPLVSTLLIPATWSEVGMGFFGALYASSIHRFVYEAYAVNGLGDGVVLADRGRTSLPRGRSSSSFEEDNNGSPAVVGRFAWNPGFGHEVGISAYQGRYNTSFIEGLRVAPARSVTLVALDVESRWRRLSFRGEGAWANVSLVPELKGQPQLAGHQWGAYVEATVRLWTGAAAGFSEAAVLVVARLDHVDLHTGKLGSDGVAGDEISRGTLGFAVRPISDTVLRLNFWRQRETDLFRNAAQSMNLQLGLATYF